jgi:hypothetical protein
MPIVLQFDLVDDIPPLLAETMRMLVLKPRSTNCPALRADGLGFDADPR